MKAKGCQHGNEKPTGTKILRGAAEKAAHRHEEQCPHAQIVVHEGLFGDQVCCTGCSRRVR